MNNQNVSAPVSLGVQRSGASLVLSWPVSATGFALQHNSDLRQSAGWSTVTQPVVVANGFNTVTVNTVASAQFFRLQK